MLIFSFHTITELLYCLVYGFLVVLQAWHRKDRQTPEKEEWVKPSNLNLLPVTEVMRETALGLDTTRTVM